jgi:large subunit ribosomal protein L17
MHRHGFQQRKLSRQRDQRNLLIRGQVTSLVLHEAITTTEAKAKTVAPVFERMVTKAKAGTLIGDRSVRKVLTSENAALKLKSELVPAFAERNGGYTRIVKLEPRRGDNAAMVRLSLVLPEAIKAAETATEAKEAKVSASKAKTPQGAAK